jgi:hypothetical protein
MGAAPDASADAIHLQHASRIVNREYRGTAHAVSPGSRQASFPLIFDPAVLLRRLTDAGVDFVVIGGLAATMHGASLLTADLDILSRQPYW